MSALLHVLQKLEARRHDIDYVYLVPGLWLNAESVDPVPVNPFDFYINRVRQIRHSTPRPLIQTKPHESGGGWSRRATIYNLFPRLTTAFDHDGDGALSSSNAAGWRETGSWLKCIALLPYIQNMGFNTVHLLPITAIGQDGRKGTLGSPYAVRNPYRLDENLSEPALELSADELFAAFVEAAHLLGLRVIVEFVLRIAARDSEWICQHPEWFYWIHADLPDRVGRGTGRLNSFGSPIFNGETLHVIKSKVTEGDFRHLPPPSSHYRAMYTQPPRPEQVFVEHGRCFATLDDGTKVRIPGAFADWPPDDVQPPWTDVTYLRMYTHPDYNYMAYNTLRMYDEQYAAPEHTNEPLWEAIAGVIPHFQKEFGIDGVMIDMGHALPYALKQRVIGAARAVNPDFAFWDENFGVSQHSINEGYNAVMGWWVLSAHEPDAIRHIVKEFSHGALPIPFMAAAENHNSPRAATRAGGLSYVHYNLALAVMLPVMPFVLTGFELGETQPINTGIGFSGDMLHRYPAEKLPLFSTATLDWCNPGHLTRSVQYALSIRHKYEELLTSTEPSSFVIGYADNPRIMVFSRRNGKHWLGVIANTDQVYEQRGRVVLQGRQKHMPGLWGTFGASMQLIDETLAYVTLSPGFVLIVDGSEHLTRAD